MDGCSWTNLLLDELFLVQRLSESAADTGSSKSSDGLGSHEQWC
jgi:hypothetical protein